MAALTVSEMQTAVHRLLLNFLVEQAGVVAFFGANLFSIRTIADGVKFGCDLSPDGLLPSPSSECSFSDRDPSVLMGESALLAKSDFPDLNLQCSPQICHHRGLIVQSARSFLV